jgi:hypothetical protein
MADIFDRIELESRRRRPIRDIFDRIEMDDEPPHPARGLDEPMIEPLESISVGDAPSEEGLGFLAESRSAPETMQETHFAINSEEPVEGTQSSTSRTTQRVGAPAQTWQAKIRPAANVVHNETAGLRPTADLGPESAEDLSSAREATAALLYNIWGRGLTRPHAPSRLTPSESSAVRRNPVACAIYQDAERAAERAASRADFSEAGTHFYHALEGQPPEKRQDWARGKPIKRFGPFRNSAPGRVRRGAVVYVEIHP